MDYRAASFSSYSSSFFGQKGAAAAAASSSSRLRTTTTSTSSTSTSTTTTSRLPLSMKINVAICGLPNIGKSSLFNALQRSS
eukprot:CAMPEP_0113503116 /NCGR_PEP_ID=MMETSP0014_2-20120614/33963_1 /TAXON_ID=2857 /ORGANISM="Nitzschia sp." /LENGTH=81 /DNA_ID=CAMNT_0000398043 /DNA_START=170 /DNA_END=412 /DNA_ORIENTATION=- /assembly_acc=CAM_ASM_000159